MRVCILAVLASVALLACGVYARVPAVNSETKELVKHLEDFEEHTYHNPANLTAIGAPFIPTPAPTLRAHALGYGHLVQPGEPYGFEPRSGYRMSEEQASAVLDADLAQAAACVYEHIVARMPSNVALTCNEFGALVSWAFNVRCHNVQTSTLAAKLVAGDKSVETVTRELLRWTIGTYRRKHGLETRRLREIDHYKKPTNEMCS